MRAAPLRLRMLAALVNVAIAVPGLLAVGGLAFGTVAAYKRLCGRNNADRGDPEDETAAVKKTRALHERPQLQAAVSGAAVGLSIASRNRRGPGYRVVGLRRVDARTGGPVSVRSAVIEPVFDQALQALTRRVFGGRARREQARIAALEPEFKELRARYADDPQRQQRALMEFYKSNRVNALAGCGWQLVGPIISQLVLALATRDGRTVRDRITGTAVVIDR